MTLPQIGITLGDPGGIGPEVTLKALSSLPDHPDARYILFGSQTVIDQERDFLKIDLTIPGDFISLREVSDLTSPSEKGKSTSVNGAASFHYFEAAVRQAKKGNLQAIVTAPVSKRSWDLAGVPWAGHTEYLSQDYPKAIMSFWSDALKIALFTHHISLAQAIGKINKKNLLAFIRQLDEYIKKIPGQQFEFLVSGLNPHAGEQGMLGKEENEHILPAIEKAQKQGISVSGPFPPDIVCRQALNKPDKIVIALYHDQGLIPFKLLAFDHGVNVTWGLPFIRTSPDHGTAFDIAGKGIADPQSMIEAILLAHRFLKIE
jgi:4-hydroxythreonine-4-phosphate dehydrogenase